MMSWEYVTNRLSGFVILFIPCTVVAVIYIPKLMHITKLYVKHKFNPPACFSVKLPSLGRCQYKGIYNINSLQPSDPYIYGLRSELFNFAEQPIKGSQAVCRKFRGILFTPVLCTVEVCYVAETLKVRAALRIQNAPPPLPKPLQQP